MLIFISLSVLSTKFQQKNMPVSAGFMDLKCDERKIQRKFKFLEWGM